MSNDYVTRPVHKDKHGNVYPKRFIKYKDGAELYSMSHTKFENLAKEAGAVYKINQMVLVNLDIFDQYLETFRVV